MALQDLAVADAADVRIAELVPSFGFRADAMAGEANVAAWREAVATLFDVDELAAGEPDPFAGDLVSYALGPVVLGSVRASGQRFRRTQDTIARSGVDHLVIQLYTQGGYVGAAGERPITVRAGDVCVLDMVQTLETRATPFANITLVVPRPKLVPLFTRPERLHGFVVAATSVMATMIGRHLQTLVELAPSMLLSECEAIIEGSIALIAACLRAELERGDVGEHGRADVLVRIRQHVESQLGDEHLSQETIATRFGLSRAGLYRLLAPYGGVESFIRSRRLHRAFFDLAAPGAQVRAVARRWHLGSEQNFTRAFKAAYGITPRMAHRVALTTLSGDSQDIAASDLSRWMRNIAPPQRARDRSV